MSPSSVKKIETFWLSEKNSALTQLDTKSSIHGETRITNNTNCHIMGERKTNFTDYVRQVKNITA